MIDVVFIFLFKSFCENSSYELRNAPISAKSLFDYKIKEVAKANYEAQQQRFLASSSTNTNVQQQKTSYSAPGVFKRPRGGGQMVRWYCVSYVTGVSN